MDFDRAVRQVSAEDSSARHRDGAGGAPHRGERLAFVERALSGPEKGSPSLRAEVPILTAAAREFSAIQPGSAGGAARAATPPPFDQVLGQIVARARLETTEGLTRFTIHLKPEFLGRIQIQTDLGRSEGLHAVIRVEDPAVRKTVAGSLGSLIEKLAEAGLKVETAEVTDLSEGNDRWTDRRGENAPPRKEKRGASPPPDEVPEEIESGERSGDGTISYFA